jgi:hypothetical protein
MDGNTNPADDEESDRSKTLERYKKFGAKEGDPVPSGAAKNAINVRTLIRRGD